MKSFKTLTNSIVKAAKAKDKPYKLTDSARLYLLISVSGSKIWKWNYRLDDKDTTYTIGEYPLISLAEAKVLRDEARKIVMQGLHPLEHKKIQQAKYKKEMETTFWSITREWIEHKKSAWSPSYLKQVELTVGRYIGDGAIGQISIKQITAEDIFILISNVAKRDKRKGLERRDKAPTLAKLLRGWCKEIFSFAIVSGRAYLNPVTALKASDMINLPKVKHNRPLNTDELRSLLNTLKEFGGMRSTSIAIELLMHTFVRTGELINAEWYEFDLEKKVWVIPAVRMKIKDSGNHIVPLSTYAVELLLELKNLSHQEKSGIKPWLFPNTRCLDKCMSPTTINRALERMGFNGKNTIGFTAHGFRGTASTLLHETGYRSEIIELQLSHKERSSVKASYNQAQYMTERIEMMEKWSGFINSLKNV